MTIDVSAPHGRAIDAVRRRGGSVGTALEGRRLVAAATFAAGIILSGPATAQFWNGGTSTDWMDGSNWSGTVPSGNVVMTNSRPAELGVTSPANTTIQQYLLGGSNGSLIIKNGSSLTVTGNTTIGTGASANATLTVTGAGSRWVVTGAQLNVGGSGTGTLNIENDGLVRATGTLRVGGSVSGTVNLRSGGILETTGLVKASGNAQVNFDNGTLRALGSKVDFADGFTVNQLTIAAGGLTVDTRGFGIGVVGFSGTGGLNVIGGGTLTLGGASSYAGATRIGVGSTLEIADDYDATGKVLQIETVLGDDTSATGLLRITGNTSGGPASVSVINAGGVGGVTATGIKIIDVGGSSAGTFNLLGDTVHNGEQAVIGGAYLYGLYKEAGDGDWYLRNIIDDEPVFQPGAPVIEAYVGAALQAFNTTESLAQRIGNRTMSDDNGLWGRIEAGHVSIAPDSTTGAGYDVTTWQLQAGLDGVLNQSEAGTLVGGLNAQFGIISADISSASGVGSVASNGYGLGATLTWYGSEGFYLDAQGKLTWFDSTLDSETLGTTIVSDNAGFGYALSLEAGQEVGLGDNWSVTPQAQLAYSAVDFDAFTSYGSTVVLADGDSLLGRLGLSIDHETQWQDPAGGTGNTRLYGIANLTYEFLEGTATSIGGDTLSSKADPLWAGIGIGGSVNWAGDQLSLYGEANLGTSLNHLGDSYSLGVTAGIRGKL
jgi:fibronectin-binding autotransporter adhesin